MKKIISYVVATLLLVVNALLQLFGAMYNNRKKIFCYAAVILLLFTIGALQLFGAMYKDLNKFFYLILICIVLLNMLLVFVEGWKFLVNLWLLMVTPVAVLLMSGVTVLFILLTYGITAFPLPANVIVVGVRATALIWSFVVLCLVMDKFETSDEKDQKETKKETPKAEQKL